MKLSENFSLSEFDCNDGSETPEAVIVNLMLLAEQLQILRDFIGKPIKINSGYRSPKYNKKIGGATRSQHLLGKASDIRVDGIKASELHGIIEELIKDDRLKIGGLGKYSSFVHLDIRQNTARWNG